MKRLGRNGMWNAVSLIDENGSFRGEAKFETRQEAEEYLAVYLQRMEKRLGTLVEGHAQVKVFDDSPQEAVIKKVTKRKKAKKRKKAR